MGSNLLRQWFMRPLLSLDEIKARHDAVGIFHRTENQDVTDIIRQKMKRMKNVHGLLQILQAGTAQWTVWKGLADFLFTALEIKSLMVEMGQWEGAIISQRLSECVTAESIGDIGASIARLIDWDQSRADGTVVIRPGVDEIIDDCNSRMAELPEILGMIARKVERDLSEEEKENIEDLNVIFFPQMGYLIAAQFAPGFEGKIPYGWDRRFQSEDTSYFKDEKMFDLDSEPGDMHGIITDRSIELIEELRSAVVAESATIMVIADVCAELDCLLALAYVARSCNLVRPKMVAQNQIAIQEGRHLLYERSQAVFVPNDTMLIGARDDRSSNESDDNQVSARRAGQRLMMITGANGSGKSAYAKQVALIVFMAQIGSFVPVKAASLGIVDKIFTRLHTRESIERHASSFMIELSQVSLALRGATPRSLLILDEFGKGTNPHDGTSLLTGVLQYLIDKGPQCPHVIAITHFQ